MRPGRGVEGIVDTIASYLQAVHGEEAAVALLLDRLRSSRSPVERTTTPPRHGKNFALTQAELCDTEDERLARIGHSIREAAPSLAWRVDDGQYYASQAAVSESYRQGNMHSILAEGDDFAMGLFMLVPGVNYLDHRHQASEFYLNLTGPSTWRFDFGRWVDLPAGSIVWNGPGRVHATQSGHSSWLSVWAWLSDIDQLCEVVEAPGHR